MHDPGEQAARHFAESVVDAVFAVWAEDLVARIELRPGDRVLDVGCGTGAVARAAAPRVGATGRVTGIDTSAARLRVAESLSAVGGAPITWLLGNAAQLPDPDASYDVVLCQQVLHLIRDRDAALREMFRVLAPGGHLGLSVWQPMDFSPAFLVIADAVERHLGSDERARFGGNFSLGDEHELRRLLEAAGFIEIAIVQESKVADFASPEEFIQYQMDVNAERWSITDETKAAMIADIQEGLQPFVVHGRLRFPRGAHIATAVRPASN